VFKTLESSGDSGIHPVLDPEQLLRGVFPHTVNMESAHAEFSRFASVWQSCYPGPSAYTLCNPVFSAKGDLLFELQPYTDPASAASDLDLVPPGSPLGRLGSRRDPFVRRIGTPRPRASSRQSVRPSAGPLSEGRANGRTRSIEGRVLTRSTSPPNVRAPQPTRPSMLSRSIPSRPSTPGTDKY